MYFQNEEEKENEEHLSQNESSEELRLLTENNIQKNENPLHKFSIIQNLNKNNITYNDNITGDIFNNKLEDKKDDVNINKNNFEDNSNKNKSNIYYLKEKSQNYKKTEDKSKNNENKNYEQYEIKETNYDYKNQGLYKEEKKIPTLNFSYDDFQNVSQENYYILNLKKKENNNIDKHNNIDENIDEDENNINVENKNEFFDVGNYNKKNGNNYDNGDKDDISNKKYKVEKSDKEKYEQIKNNSNNMMINNKIGNEYSNFLNQKMDIYQKDLQKSKNSNNKENIYDNKQINYDNDNDNEIEQTNKNLYNEYKEIINEKESENKTIINNENYTNNNKNETAKKNSDYFFNYDNTINLRNYYPIKSGKTEYSTEQNTINHNNKGFSSIEEKEHKDFRNSAFDLNMKAKEKETISKIEENNYNENYIKYNDIIGAIKIYNNKMDNENKNVEIDNNSNNKIIKKLKYINDINNAIIFDTFKKNKTSKSKENINTYIKIPELNINDDRKEININNHDNKTNSNLNSYRSINYKNNDYLLNNNNNQIKNIEANLEIKEKQNNSIIKEDYKNINYYKNIDTNNNTNDNISRTNDSMNLNTLESVRIRKIEEEDAKRTMEIEQETKKLNELEKEKMKLILEEKERREKILEEIDRQEKEEKEKKKLRRKKYEQSLRKKKEDEEKLKKIKIEQEKQMKEINELIYKRKLDEEKLLLLTEGKLNKQQRKNYKNFIKNEKYKNQNKLPFDINNRKNNEILERMKNKYITKDSKSWNSNEQTINYNSENNKNLFRKNKKINYNNYTKSYRNFNNYNINESTINFDKNNFEKNKDDKMNINIKTNLNNFMSFSPTSNFKKKPFSLSPTNNMEINNKLNTELQQKNSISPFQKNEQIIKGILNENDKNVEIINKESNNEQSKENSSYLYKKKLKKYYNNININVQNNIDNYNNKNNKEKNSSDIKPLSNEKRYKIKNSNDKNSFIELKEIKEITSKMADEIEKKIDIINNNSIIKAKSTPKFNPYSKYKNSHNRTNISTKKENKIETNNHEFKNQESNKKVNKYTKLTKGSKIELSNLINNEFNIDKEERKIIKQKSFMEDFVLPNDIKKECLLELNKLDKNKKGKKIKDNMQLSIGISDNSKINKKINKTFDNKNNNIKNKEKNTLKKMETFKENKNYNIGNQKIYYKEFLYGSEKNDNYLNENYLSENNSRFLPYYKEIYG